MWGNRTPGKQKIRHPVASAREAAEREGSEQKLREALAAERQRGQQQVQAAPLGAHVVGVGWGGCGGGWGGGLGRLTVGMEARI